MTNLIGLPHHLPPYTISPTYFLYVPMSPSLVKNYSLKIMWICIVVYLLSSLPALATTSIGPWETSQIRAFLILPTFLSIGIVLSLSISIQKDHISFAKLAVCGIFLLSILGVFLFL